MAIANGMREVPDSEDELMSSSPADLPNVIVDKLSTIVPASHKETKDVPECAAPRLPDTAEEAANTAAECNDGLDAQQKKASLDDKVMQVNRDGPPLLPSPLEPTNNTANLPLLENHHAGHAIATPNHMQPPDNSASSFEVSTEGIANINESASRDKKIDLRPEKLPTSSTMGVNDAAGNKIQNGQSATAKGNGCLTTDPDMQRRDGETSMIDNDQLLKPNATSRLYITESGPTCNTSDTHIVPSSPANNTPNDQDGGDLRDPATDLSGADATKVLQPPESNGPPNEILTASGHQVKGTPQTKLPVVQDTVAPIAPQVSMTNNHQVAWTSNEDTLQVLHEDPKKDIDPVSATMQLGRDTKPASIDQTSSPSSQPPQPKTQQEITLAELKTQKAALLASLGTLPAIQVLMEEMASSAPDNVDDNDEPTEADIFAAANRIVKDHIKLLHEYNELKDMGQGLMGLIADQRGLRIVEVQEEFGIDSQD